MPDWLSILLLGLIEGVTEFLPVSSTGHLLIAEQWLHPAVDKAHHELFNVVIQAGAMLAVLAVFSKRARDLVARSGEPATRDYLVKLISAFLITAVGGLLLKKVLHWELPKTAFPVAIATLVGGIVILGIERGIRGRTTTQYITWGVALTVGLAQVLAAAFPGTSRSGACILFALTLGIARPAATEFSFLVGIPTMFAASGLEIFGALRHGDRLTGSDWGSVALGSLVACGSAFLVVRWLLRFVQSNTFVLFGWYRIALGAGLLAMRQMGWIG
ncbi:MAG TPA: undecaprenyl-diphosphatase [Verrucomicrobiales bacterium]|nr:undecaprenyl-diphosphatase [Verrucomicrobiales bacterium]